MKEEIWKDIPGYEGSYQVSDHGNVKSLNYRNTGKERNLTYTLGSHGYHCVTLIKDKKSRNGVLIHRLVADVFIPKVEGKPLVDHRDTNKLNNHVGNLRWVTRRENAQNLKGKKEGKMVSKYVGLCWMPKNKKWRVNIQVNGVREYLGIYRCEYAAADTYDKALMQLGLDPVNFTYHDSYHR